MKDSAAEPHSDSADEDAALISLLVLSRNARREINPQGNRPNRLWAAASSVWRRACGFPKLVSRGLGSFQTMKAYLFKPFPMVPWQIALDRAACIVAWASSEIGAQLEHRRPIPPYHP